MINIFQILMNASRDVLCGSSSHISSVDETEYEFAECICESMVSLGSTNLLCIAGNSSVLPFYIQQVSPEQINSVLFTTLHYLVPSHIRRGYEFSPFLQLV